MEPLISVIMPVFNVEKYIDESIKSILNQTYQNTEIIVVDDKSSDGTLGRIRALKDDRIKIFQNEEKLGYTKTCNKIFPMCAGDYITFQDGDDYSSTDRFGKQLEAFRKDPDLGICGTGMYIISEDGKLLDQVNRTADHEEILVNIQKGNQFVGATIMVKKEVVEDIGYYRERFAGWGNQDYDWSYRIVEKYKGINLQLPLYYYRQQLYSNSKKILVERAICPQIIQFLGRQRAKTGKDSLMNQNTGELDELLKELKKPYLDDKSLVYRQHANNRLYIRQYADAFRIAWRATMLNPLNLRNYLIFPYGLLRMVINFFKETFNNAKGKK
ncbi:glycosyltransferase [Fulvivirgaceae bacterium BMA12]|uniref:Glycosyltransferase n=1 Tax=Agaribacillus aureus TaxID=3051825 RepID=A0ABT8LDW4_9BACT|nr:glycosyltransferase [Fulvivirgaceae bacterium BMA12]